MTVSLVQSFSVAFPTIGTPPRFTEFLRLRLPRSPPTLKVKVSSILVTIQLESPQGIRIRIRIHEEAQFQAFSPDTTGFCPIPAQRQQPHHLSQDQSYPVVFGILFPENSLPTHIIPNDDNIKLLVKEVNILGFEIGTVAKSDPAIERRGTL